MIEIYRASTTNVRELKKQRASIKRLFNRAIIQKDKMSQNLLTKLYALLYSSFVEVCFLKIIHTPYGFTDPEILQIYGQRNLELKVSKCLELAFLSIDKMAGRGEIQNKKQILVRYIEQYILSPSQLRNKIAHGQWSVALNNDNTAINADTTAKINNLDFVKVDILFSVFEKIGQAIEDLIESPYKAHFNDFYFHTTELETLVSDTSTWTLESKTKILEEKQERVKKINLSKTNGNKVV